MSNCGYEYVTIIPNKLGSQAYDVTRPVPYPHPASMWPNFKISGPHDWYAGPANNLDITKPQYPVNNYPWTKT